MRTLDRRSTPAMNGILDLAELLRGGPADVLRRLGPAD
jgi:hypothetical protein